MEQYAVLNPIEVATKALIPFRQILNEIVIEKGLKIPPQLDIIVDSVLMGHFIYYSHNIFNDDIYTEKFEKAVVDHIRVSNHQKLVTPALNDTSYSLPITAHIPDFKSHFFKIHIEKGYAEKLILQTIKTSMAELSEIIKGYNNGEEITPAAFFFNCFIHPQGVIDISKHYTSYQKYIDKDAIEIFRYLLIEITLYLQDFVNKINQQ